MKSLSIPALVVVAAVFSAPLAARAAVSGFESGTMAGWSVSGAGHVNTASMGITPTGGTYLGELETTGNLTTSSAAISLLNVSSTDVYNLVLDVPLNGTVIYRSVTVSAGDTLSFDWNFISDELDESSTFNDFAFWTVFDGTTGVPYLLGARNLGISYWDSTSPPPGFDGQMGWHTESYTFSAAGTYEIGFAAFNVGDHGHNSALLLDNITLPDPVPEPASLVGLVGAGLFIARRRRAQR